ncbi:S66 family peptidase [Butyrivibrio sp. AE3009]|uniref:S66 family peptidase n=1 Tax=Butyrivibrio sp. AE3009 TaxID=1280666 RepID=UPI0003B5A919|nr:S66 peptidase family protein [Butyrivibrio sp. AE3009]
MIKRPEYISKGDTIGITAPAFAPSIEPYSLMYGVAVKKLKERGYNIIEGPTVFTGDGIGISTDPKVCAKELVEFYTRDDVDAIISAGGGELMNETITYVDFEALKSAKPKWFLGYSDNTNFIFPLVTISGVMGIYGPCICHFSKAWEKPEDDVFALLEGTGTSFTGYDRFVRPRPRTSPLEDGAPRDEASLEKVFSVPYDYDADKILVSYDCVGGKAVKAGDSQTLSMSGVLLGGCLDVLEHLVGTRFDNMKKFNEENPDVIWMLEACDFTTLEIRRSLWNLREAGWFDSAKGFLIGRPYGAFESNIMGVDQYNAVTAMLEGLGVPIILDADFGHLDPQLALVMGAKASVTVTGNDMRVDYLNG